MQIVFIYGPPAAGKLTVANELAKLTKYKVLHNHLAIELVNLVHDFGTPRFYELIDKYRLELINDAASQGKINGLILTFVYTPIIGDIKFVKQLIKVSKNNNGKIHFVQLCTTRNELVKRVNSKSRQKYSKLKDPKKLIEILESWDTVTPIDFVPSLRIDNSKLSAKKTALKIKEYYHL